MARVLTPGEKALAERVFGSAIRLDSVRLHGFGFGRFAVTIGSHIFLPASIARADFADAEHAPRALLVHELTHVWQFQTRPLWTLASWARQLLTGGYGPGLPAYRYALPLGSFDRLNLEQQASAVEHAFLLQENSRAPGAPPGAEARHYAGLPFPLRG